MYGWGRATQISAPHQKAQSGGRKDRGRWGRKDDVQGGVPEKGGVVVGGMKGNVKGGLKKIRGGGRQGGREGGGGVGEGLQKTLTPPVHKDGGGRTGKAQNGSIPALSEDLQFIDSIVRKEVGRSAGQVCAHAPGAPPMISMLSSTTASRSAFFGNLVASFNRQDYPNKELLVIIYIIYV